MVNIEAYLTATLIQIGRGVLTHGAFPEDGCEDRVRQLLNKGIDFLSTKGMKMPLNFRYLNVLALYEPYGAALVTEDGWKSKTHSETHFFCDCSAVCCGARQIPREPSKRVDVDFINEMMSTYEARAQDFVSRVEELCLLFGIELDCWEKDAEFNKYLFLEFVQQTTPQLKYSTNLVFTRFWDVEDPERVPLNYLGFDIFPKRLSVELKRLCSKDQRRRFLAQVKVNSLFMGFKKGLLPSGPEVIQKSLNTNGTKLSRVVEVDPFILSDLKDKVSTLVKYIDNNNSTVFEEIDIPKQSASSTLASDFASGGNIGHVQRELYGENRFSMPVSFGQGVKDKVFKYPNLYYECIGFCFNKEDRFFQKIIPVNVVCPVQLRDMLEVFPNKFINYEHEEGSVDSSLVMTNKVAPCFVLEPMKVRTITKPSTGVHVRMHKIQKQLWRKLYNCDLGFFQLIGEPLTKEHLYPLLADWRIGDQIVSGDYSAATDNLNGGVSLTIINELLSGLKDNVLRENIVNTLTSAEIRQDQSIFPKYLNAFDSFRYMVKEPFIQKNGQLMGHVISFVVLCIANFCCYWQAVERFVGKTVSLATLKRDFPVRINGDDIIFRTRSNLYDHWLTSLRHYGFEPSLGKNFVTDKFMQVNSELYRIDSHLNSNGDFRITNLVKIPYVNFGLITNRNKQDCSKDTTVKPIADTSRSTTVLLRSEKGTISEDSLLGRLKTYPKIACSALCMENVYGDLRSSLPSKLQKVTNDLLVKHYRPVLRHFGLWIFYKDFTNPLFQEEYSKYIVKNQKVFTNDEAEQAKLFDELTLKLDRGILTWDYETQARRLRKKVLGNPFFVFPLVLDSPVEYIRA